MSLGPIFRIFSTGSTFVSCVGALGRAYFVRTTAATGCHGDAAPPRPLGVDAGGEVDAGPALDAGPAMDAGLAMDAGTSLDAGPTIDAGTGVDAGPMCLPTQTLCGGLCKDLQTDRFHCGMCGMVCGRGQMCCAGTCRLGACL